jgi:Fur family ferric uptake transcriptional regulator
MDSIYTLIRKDGHRLTNQRKQILTLIGTTPQSIGDLMNQIEQEKLSVDKATVYRALDWFVEMGIVGKTKFQDGVTKYERVTNDSHHHHLVCNSCGSIEDIPLNEQALMKEVKYHSQFKVLGHSLEFFGVCHMCQQRKDI